MQKNTLMWVFVVVVVLVGGYFFITKSAATEHVAFLPAAQTSAPMASVTPLPATTPEAASPVIPDMVVATPAIPVAVSKVEAFTMTAYYDEKGKWYSLKQMTVKKGDTVKLSITNVKGMHNFNIDELGIQKDLPLNKKVVVEFTADKVGDFVYYCSMPGHRSGGQWGTLHVTE